MVVGSQTRVHVLSGMKRAMVRLGMLVAVPVAMEHRFDHIDLLLGTPSFCVCISLTAW